MGGSGDSIIKKMARNVTAKIPQIINLAEKYDLPHKFLRYVAANYGKFELRESDSESSKTDTTFNNVYLQPSDFKVLINLDPSEKDIGSSSAVQTFYHEMTHAYLDLREEDVWVKAIVEDSEKYYENAPLDNGDDVSRTYQVTQEAAGAYVGHRVSVYWDALQRLHWLRDSRAKREIVVGNLWSSIGAIESHYNKDMKKNVFGYQQYPLGNQINVKKAIYHRLKQFCDAEILHQKTKDTFSELLKVGTVKTNHFKRLVEEIKQIELLRQEIWNKDNSADTGRFWA